MLVGGTKPLSELTPNAWAAKFWFQSWPTMSASVRAVPTMMNSGKYFSRLATPDRNTGRIGSQPQTSVVMFRSFIWAMIPVAWSDIVARSRTYFRLKPRSLPALVMMAAAFSTDSWYQEFSGASVAKLRGRSWRGWPSPPLPPA